MAVQEYSAALPSITVIQRANNRRGQALARSGMQAGKTERWIILDADGEYPPECIPDLLPELSSWRNARVCQSLGGKIFSMHRGMPFCQCLAGTIISALRTPCYFDSGFLICYIGVQSLATQITWTASWLCSRSDGFEQVLELAVCG